jgi:hypothetical protein
VKLPKKLRIGPHIYTVSGDLADIEHDSREQGSALNGSCDKNRLRITVAPDQAHTKAAETIVHETLHALTALVGLADEWSDTREEQVVSRLAPALCDLLRRNPRLVAYVCHDSVP